MNDKGSIWDRGGSHTKRKRAKPVVRSAPPMIVGRLDCPRCGPETLFVSRQGVVSCCHCGHESATAKQAKPASYASFAVRRQRKPVATNGVARPAASNQPATSASPA